MVAAKGGLQSPVPMSAYPTLSVLLLAGGLASSAVFFVYESTSSRHTRRISYELALSLLSSTLLGFGTLFLLLWTGVYV